MPRPYPPEFRARAIALVREGRQVKQTALDLGIHEVTLHNWLRQDDIDHGRRPGLSSQESAELRAARGRVRQLEQEIAILRRAATWLDEEGGVGPKRAHPVIDRLVDAGAPTSTCCRLLGVSRQGYYRYRKRPTSATELRRRWLTGLIREIHVASRGTYGYRRIHAELTIGMNISCSSRLISVLMTRAGIGGLPGPARIKRLKGVATADDLVNRKFHRLALNELWVTDITEHPTREGKIYCAAVLDACSRKIIGWAIDSKQDSTLVVNALDMAIRARQPGPGGIVHADHGVQFTSWVFTQKIRSAGLLPSFGTVGDGLDNAMMESFWSTMQIELLNRKKWKTRIELANAIFEYIEVFYNRRRRHSSLEYATPHDYDLAR
ncbi:IS3-like element ISAar24 family transposase, partial [Brachybacterium alimentarium]